MSNERNEIYEFAGFRLDVREHTLRGNNGRDDVNLPEKAFQTLCVLVQNSGHLVTKRELLDTVWPDSFVEENNLDKSIHAIRNALGERTSGRKYIETVRKHGYRFVADVRAVERPGRVAASVPQPVLSESGQHAVVSLADWPELAELAERKTPPLNENEPAFEAQKKDLQIPSGKEQPGGSKSFYFYLATAAGIFVCALVLGGWFVNGSRWRAEVAAEPTGSKALSSEPLTTDPGRSPAYDLYVRGKVKVASENREDTEAAVKLLEEAVAVDPNFAEAYAQLARGYNTMAFKYSADTDRKRLHENAEVAIEKALALDPNLAEGHFARGLILWSNTRGFPHEQAIQSYKRSLALDPNLDETHHQLSLVYSHIGLIKEARGSVKKTLELNPNNTLARFRTGVYIAYEGKFDEAIAIYKTIPRDFTPLLVDRSTAEALVQTGRTSEAEAIVDDYISRFPQDEGGSFTSVKALLLARAGKLPEAEDAIRRANEIGAGFGHFHHTTYNIASAYAIMNRPEEAVKWLEISADRGFPNYLYFSIDPNLNNIRDHALYREFMSRLKLQWERYKSLS